MDEKVFKQEMVDWNNNARFYSNEGGMPYQDIVRKEISKAYNLSQSDFILDAGGGTSEPNAKTISIDFAVNMLKPANQNITTRGGLVLCSVHALPFKSGVFDAVVANGLFHHLKVQGVLKEGAGEILRVLKRGGKLCIFDRAPHPIPNFFLYLRKPFKLVITPKSQCNTRNEVPFLERDLTAILRQGFKMKRRKFMVGLLFQFMIISTNVIQYVVGPDAAKYIQSKTKEVGASFEKYFAFKMLCAEQCVVLEKGGE